MSFVYLHQREPGGQGLAEVEAFTLDEANCDKWRHQGQVPVMLASGGVVWASEGDGAGQFSAPKPITFDPKTGAPIVSAQNAQTPTGYDPVTGNPIYAKPAATAAPKFDPMTGQPVPA